MALTCLRFGVVPAMLLLASITACTRPAPEGSSSEPGPAKAAVEKEADPQVQGSLSEASGHRVLRVWGTPQQMGYAHGALLRTQILDVVDHYALRALPPTVVETMGPRYDGVADIPEPLRTEATALIEGMKATGGAYSETLGRDLLPRDLLVLNAMTDLLSIGCSSVSAWGDATAATGLKGAPAMVRNLDWSDDPALLRNQVVIVYEPSTEGRQSVVSVAFAGYIGCLTCMSRSGVVATFNMGYGGHAASALQAAGGFAPANLLLRDTLERGDVDGDGRSTGADVETAVAQARHAGSFIVHVLDDSGETPRVLEVESDGVVVRRPDPQSPLGPNTLAATNHFRDKAAPTSCRRYASLQRRISRSPTFGKDALWQLGMSVRLPEVAHTVLFLPRDRTLRVWLRGEDEDATSDLGAFDWTFD